MTNAFQRSKSVTRTVRTDAEDRHREYAVSRGEADPDRKAASASYKIY
jgi:hypothetical protein